MNVVNLFLENAKKYPNKVAIIEHKKRITFGNLAKEVKSTAAYFQSKGIQKGDRVLVFVPMSIDLYRVVLALYYIGATAVFLDAWVNKKRLELCCRIADCKGFIGVWKARAFAWFSKELRQIPIKLSLKKTLAQDLEVAKVAPNDAALITFTTGSTGTPKAALRSHDFLKEQFEALIEEINPKPSDVAMPVLPIVLFMNLGAGCTSVIANFKMSKPDTLNPSLIIEQIQKDKVNRITSSPFFIKKLSEHLLNNKAISIPSIQQLVTGGAAVFPKEANLYKEAFPDSQILVAYGSTEAEPISSIEINHLLANADKLSEGLPVGDIFDRASVRIIPVRSEAIPKATENELLSWELPDGELGEIIVSGPHVLKQYFNNETAFKENKIVCTDTGIVWHRTGDSGFRKEQQLYLTGRCKQLIQRNGQYLAPFIIENQLQSVEGIEMGTLIEQSNQLFLVVASTLSEAEVAQKTSHLNLPFDHLKILPSLPMDPRHRSKIDYGALGGMIGSLG